LLFHARQINSLNEINKRYGCFGCTVGLVNLHECRFCQVSRFGFCDSREDTIDLLSHLGELLCDSDPFHFAIDNARVEITDVPDSSRLEDVPVLLSFSFKLVLLF
jgi:hypothetical protein